jgi:hypothetical protein
MHINGVKGLKTCPLFPVEEVDESEERSGADKLLWVSGRGKRVSISGCQVL